MKTVCEFTGLSDSAAEFLAQLVKDKDYEKLSIVNHLFQELCEDYDFYNGEDEVSSVLGSLFRYFEKFSKWENAWEDYVDLCDEERNQVLAAAYKQYMLNRVTEAVKTSLEAYREYNKPWEWVPFLNMQIRRFLLNTADLLFIERAISHQVVVK